MKALILLIVHCRAFSQTIEMGGISKQGFGMLSPTIATIGDKTLMLGIVPDKLATEENYRMGWAHLYSLPREISLAADGTLVQKPFSGLTSMRSSTTFSKSETLAGIMSLAPVSGRHLELLGEFTLGTTGTVGFNFLKSGSNQAQLCYDVAGKKLTLDLTSLPRTANDTGSYNGRYAAQVPQVGGTLKLHVFIDGSIADIFVGDTWAFSVRLFPTDSDGIEAEAFATAATPSAISAWTLQADNSQTGIDEMEMPVNNEEYNDRYYDLQGRQVTNLTKGIYIHKGKKIVIQDNLLNLRRNN